MRLNPPSRIAPLSARGACGITTTRMRTFRNPVKANFGAAYREDRGQGLEQHSSEKVIPRTAT
jgi:hypothetical protein